MALPLGGSASFEDLRVESFELFARVGQVSFAEVARWVCAAAASVRGVWADKAHDLPFTSAERTRLNKHLKRVPLSG